MDEKIKICITAETIHDMTRAYMTVCRSREDDISFHNKDKLQLELDGCFIKFMLPGSNEVYQHRFDQIIIAGDRRDANNREWIDDYLIPRANAEKIILDSERLAELPNNSPFWNNPRFPYRSN